jgi:hypothetical protein
VPRPRNALTPSLDRATALCRVLLLEGGWRIDRQQARAGAVDLHVQAVPLWRQRPVRVRLIDRAASRNDLRDLAEVAAAEGLADAVLIETTDAQGERPSLEGSVQVLNADAFERRLRESALVRWDEGQPEPNLGRIEEWWDLARTAAAHDPVGLRWLPTLAANRIPAELEATGQTADELFERIAFRLLTTVFRFSGERLGQAARGQRLPDALLYWPAGSTTSSSAFLDCKAYAGGFSMSTADERAQREYAIEKRQVAEGYGHVLRFLLILSSDFSGDFELRRANLLRDARIELAYLRASDLVALALDLELAEERPIVRELYPWDQVLALGQPTLDDLRGGLEAAREAAPLSLTNRATRRPRPETGDGAEAVS